MRKLSISRMWPVCSGRAPEPAAADRGATSVCCRIRSGSVNPSVQYGLRHCCGHAQPVMSSRRGGKARCVVLCGFRACRRAGDTRRSCR